jgi:hypothetical protein
LVGLEGADLTAESGITAVAVCGLLIGLVCLGVFLTSNIGVAKKATALDIAGVWNA